MLPIDAFIAAKTGTCRHYAFVTAYFLDRLQKEGVLPEGTSYYVRDIVPGGGHAWNLYILKDESEAWHIDTLWGVNKNLKNKEDLKFLYKFYGIKAINHERKRFLNL